jgi:hypothetical protein
MMRDAKAKIAAAIQSGESDEAYLRRRADEERQQMAETSCMVRSVHEEFAEEYEERLQAAEEVTASLESLAKRVSR